MADEFLPTPITFKELVETKIGAREVQVFITTEHLISETLLDRLLAEPIKRNQINKSVSEIKEVMQMSEAKYWSAIKQGNDGQIHVANKLTVYHLLGWCYANLGDYKNEESVYREELKIYGTKVAENAFYHLMCIPPLNELAKLYLNVKNPTFLNYEQARNCLDESYKRYETFSHDFETVPAGFIVTMCISDPAAAGTGKVNVNEKTRIMADTYHTLTLHIDSSYYKQLKQWPKALKIGMEALQRQLTVHPNNLDPYLWAIAVLEVSEMALYTDNLKLANYLLSVSLFAQQKLSTLPKPDTCSAMDQLKLPNHNSKRLIKRLRGESELSHVKIAVWILERRYKMSLGEIDEEQECDTFTPLVFQKRVKVELPSVPLPDDAAIDLEQFIELHRNAKVWMKSARRILTKPQWDILEGDELQKKLDNVATMRI